MKKKSSLKHTGAFWAFCAPCCILFGVFFLVPLVLSIAFSFTNYDGWKTIDFVGLTNYITLFKDSKFYLSLGRTLLYTVCTLPFRVIIPLLVAVLLCSNRVAAKSLTRTMVYIPVLMSALVVGITINWMFSQEYGFVNFIIRSLGGTALEWSLNPRLATFVIAFASVWASIGFNMILYIGGINSISNDLYEAATIDGASGVQAFLPHHSSDAGPHDIHGRSAVHRQPAQRVRPGPRYHAGRPWPEHHLYHPVHLRQGLQPDAVWLCFGHFYRCHDHLCPDCLCPVQG